MPRPAAPKMTAETLGEFLRQLGDVPAERIRMNPLPGTAREADVTAALESIDKRFYELVDGVLIERPLSLWRSLVAAEMIGAIMSHEPIDGQGVVLNCL